MIRYIYSGSVGRVNGRRVGQQRRTGKPSKVGKEKGEKEKDSAPGPDLHLEPTLILAKTENVITEPIERTVEVKVSRFNSTLYWTNS